MGAQKTLIEKGKGTGMLLFAHDVMWTARRTFEVNWENKAARTLRFCLSSENQNEYDPMQNKLHHLMATSYGLPLTNIILVLCEIMISHVSITISFFSPSPWNIVRERLESSN